MRLLPWLCLVCLLGCNRSVEPAPAPLCIRAETIEWDTRGGGDLRFDVKRGDNEGFVVRVNRRQFREVDITMVLTREKSLPVYDLVARVLDGKEDLSGSDSPERGETGTWTSVYVIDRAKQRHKVASSRLQSQLQDLRYWIEEQLPPQGATPDSHRQTSDD